MGYISYRFRDKQWFRSKIAKFPTFRVFYASADGVPLWIRYRRMESKSSNDGATGWPKKFSVGLAVLHTIPACDWQTADIRAHTAQRQRAKDCAMHSVARVKSRKLKQNNHWVEHVEPVKSVQRIPGVYGVKDLWKIIIMLIQTLIGAQCH